MAPEGDAEAGPAPRQREADRPLGSRVPRLLTLRRPRCGEERLIDTDERGHWCDACGFGPWRIAS